MEMSFCYLRRGYSCRVSGELSSMEIRKWKRQKDTHTEFQENLVVWKL